MSLFVLRSHPSLKHVYLWDLSLIPTWIDEDDQCLRWFCKDLGVISRLHRGIILFSFEWCLFNGLFCNFIDVWMKRCLGVVRSLSPIFQLLPRLRLMLRMMRGAPFSYIFDAYFWRSECFSCARASRVSSRWRDTFRLRLPTVWARLRFCRHYSPHPLLRSSGDKSTSEGYGVTLVYTS